MTRSTLHCGDAAVAALDAGNVDGFLGKAESNTQALDLVSQNVRRLQDRGLYEAALLQALTTTRSNNATWSEQDLPMLVSFADRDRFRAAGDPLPGAGPFTVYRGVAGRGRARRVLGLSWTFSLPLAAWFARRAKLLYGLPDPTVFRLTVPEAQVLAYAHQGHRHEEELLVLCNRRDQPQRCLDGAELVAAAAAHDEAMRRDQEKRLARLRVR